MWMIFLTAGIPLKIQKMCILSDFFDACSPDVPAGADLGVMHVLAQRSDCIAIANYGNLNALMMGTFVTLLFIGIVVGWIYKGLVGKSGPALGVCMAFAVLGALAGGLIFLFTGLGGEFLAGLLASFLVLVAADVLSREVAHE